jgi:hypothetical protein
LLASFSQIYSKNWSKKQQKILKNLQFGQKRGACKFEAREGMVAERLVPLKRSQGLEVWLKW